MTPKKILIIQLRRVGDVVFTLPVAGVLRKNFPEARIDFLVEPPSDQLVRLNPRISRTLVYEKGRPAWWLKNIREQRYDWVLDFHSNGRTLLLTFFSGAPVRAGFKGPLSRRIAYTHSVPTGERKYIVEQKLEILKALGLDIGKWSWELEIPRKEMDWAENFLKSSGLGGAPGNLVGIAPATRRATRAWVPERFGEAARSLSRSSNPVVFLWGPGEKDLIDAIVKRASSDGNLKNLVVPPETSLLQLSALVRKCSLVLAVDNGPKNIAVALKVPTLTISGPTHPLSFNPHDDPSHQILRDEELFCIACELNRCPYGHECMENIGSESVIRKIRRMLDQNRKEEVLGSGRR
jgi:ADP-heptose:LPS heptosyltransferase